MKCFDLTPDRGSFEHGKCVILIDLKSLIMNTK